MHQEAEPADRGEQDEAQRDQVIGQLRQHQAEEIERDHGIELALAMLASTELVGNLDGTQLALRGRHHVEQDLEALGRELRRELLETVAADHEKAAHGIGDLDLQRAARDLGGERTGAGTLLVEAVGLVALDIAAADHEVGLAALQQRQHLRELGLVMLQIGVHHGGIGRARGQDALDAGARQAAPTDPADAAHPRILPRQAAHQIPGSVG